jgi:hypothetical protein
MQQSPVCSKKMSLRDGPTGIMLSGKSNTISMNVTKIFNISPRKVETWFHLSFLSLCVMLGKERSMGHYAVQLSRPCHRVVTALARPVLPLSFFFKRHFRRLRPYNLIYVPLRRGKMVVDSKEID